MLNDSIGRCICQIWLIGVEMKRLTALLLLLPIFAFAESPHWLKNDNPNELGWQANVSDMCNITRSAVVEVVKGVFVRSRIKPIQVSNSEYDRLYMIVGMQCYPVTKADYVAYTLDVDFGTYIEYSGWRLPVRLLADSFGSIGIQDKDGLLGAVKEGVELAITDYLKANFDLSDDE